MGDYALGYFSDPVADPDQVGRSDIRSPEHALGRRPREGIGAGDLAAGDPVASDPSS